jgi:hypothetical protein
MLRKPDGVYADPGLAPGVPDARAPRTGATRAHERKDVSRYFAVGQAASAQQRKPVE